MTVIELAEVHKGDIGTVFRLTLTDDGVAVDISGATTKQIIFEKPDGSLLTKAATFTSDGTNGMMFYAMLADELDQAGVWKIQGVVVLAGGTWRTSTHEFKVHENL